MTAEYLAGIMDGEGSVTISGRTRAKKPWYTVQVHIAMKNRNIIERIHEAFGGNFCSKGSGMWVVSWYNQKAVDLLECLLPHLILKRHLAELCIRFNEYRVSQRRVGGVRGGQFPAEYHQNATKFVMESKQLVKEQYGKAVA